MAGAGTNCSGFITDSANHYAREVAARAAAAGLRVETDLRNEKISYGAGAQRQRKCRLFWRLADAEAGMVALRRLGSNDQQVLDANETILCQRRKSCT